MGRQRNRSVEIRDREEKERKEWYIGREREK